MNELIQQRNEISEMLVKRVHQLLESRADASEVKAFMAMMIDDQQMLLAVQKFKAAEAEKIQPVIKRTPEMVSEAFCLLFGKEYVA